jgi:LEA14-like dessication related protein
MTRRLALAAATAITFGLSGCSLFLHSIEKPKVDVRDVALSSVSLMAGVEGTIRLDVENPNPVGVPLRAIDWQLAVAGAPAVRGHVDVSTTIPARGVAPVTASLAIGAGDAVEVARRMAGGGRGYALDARLFFSTSVGEVEVDVHKDGDLADGIAMLR